MRCSHCNSKLRKNAKFCPACGIAVIWEENPQVAKPPAKKQKLVVLLISVLTLICVAAFLALKTIDINKGTTVETEPTTAIQQSAFADDPTAISNASKSVVMLTCYDKTGRAFSSGSGFACFENNIIVTNYHVIEGGAYSINITTESGYIYTVDSILALDKKKDLAILQTSTHHNLSLLQLSKASHVLKGEQVVAIGSPLGLLNSVSTGVFSGEIVENGVAIYQFTAPISSGSSGGALFNSSGDVIGITSASYINGQNLNLAVPSKYICDLYDSKTTPVAFDVWFEKNDGGRCYLNYSTPTSYQNLLATPKLYHNKIVTFSAYVIDTSDGFYLLPSQNDITWEGEPYGFLFGEKMFGYHYFCSDNGFEDTKIISCVDNYRNITSSSYKGKTVTITGWFEYDDKYADTSASIDLLYISE